MPNLWSYLVETGEFNSELITLAEQAWAEIAPQVQAVEAVRAYNQLRVLDAFRAEGIAAHHFTGSTGYGYGDIGRDALESLYARVFGAEAAIVRPQLASGTHAIATALFGVLRPGDELLYATGAPYDTLLKTIGVVPAPGSLREFGITYAQAPLRPDGRIDVAAVLELIRRQTKVIAFQRSRGYTWRPSYSVAELADAITAIKSQAPEVIIFVDNCYGEFVETKEPSQVGADLVAGSLIKNPGGTLAPFGGYIVGSANLIEQVYSRLTAPGLGADVGPTGETGLRLFFQGLYLAPHFTCEALVGAIFAAQLLQKLGLEVSPSGHEPRADIIQAIRLRSREELIGFCQGIQLSSPIDSRVMPVPAPMAGYADEVIMSAGAFVQGASSELSADAPLREPFNLFLQGGSTREQVIYAVLTAIMRSRII